MSFKPVYQEHSENKSNLQIPRQLVLTNVFKIHMKQNVYGGQKYDMLLF